MRGHHRPVPGRSGDGAEVSRAELSRAKASQAEPTSDKSSISAGYGPPRVGRKIPLWAGSGTSQAGTGPSWAELAELGRNGPPNLNFSTTGAVDWEFVFKYGPVALYAPKFAGP